MKTNIAIGVIAILLGGCATAPTGEQVKRDRMRDCPPGTMQICESRRLQKPSAGGDEEIPEYDYCRCESMIN
jgi:hypothetical protein